MKTYIRAKLTSTIKFFLFLRYVLTTTPSIACDFHSLKKCLHFLTKKKSPPKLYQGFDLFGSALVFSNVFNKKIPPTTARIFLRILCFL